MDARTGFATGGFIVGATVVAVACAATLSNNAALADVPGKAAGLDVVRVSPSAAVATPTPRATASSEPVAAPEISAPAAPVAAEVVPAPEPEDVPAPAPVAVEPPAVAPSTPAAAPVSKEEIQEEALRTGSWERLRAWANTHGWSSQRVEHWIARLQANNTQTPANAGNGTGRDYSFGSKRNQSPQPPQGD